MQGQRVLVTGGAGFIGSNLANALAADNEVLVVDDLFLGTEENLVDAVDFYEMSVLDEDLPADVDVLFHLAALSSMQMHEDDPQRGARVNVEGFVNTVEQYLEHGGETVVYATTSSIYGDRTEPAPESMDVEVRTGYEASKLAREQYAEYYANYYDDLTMAGLRYFSVYQGMAEGAEAHKGEFANIIAQFADELANGRAPEIYGDGSQTRDFTHVDDVVDATIRAAEAELTGIYNVGTGEQYDFETVVEMINDELGTDIQPEYVENPIPEDVYVHDTMADISKFTEATGWEPAISFEEGIERVCEPYT